MQLLFDSAGVQVEDSKAAGRLCILPLLLASVLPLTAPGAVLDMLRTLCHDTPSAPAWASQYPQVGSAHLQSAPCICSHSCLLIQNWQQWCSAKTGTVPALFAHHLGSLLAQHLGLQPGKRA